MLFFLSANPQHSGALTKKNTAKTCIKSAQNELTTGTPGSYIYAPYTNNRCHKTAPLTSKNKLNLCTSETASLPAFAAETV